MMEDPEEVKSGLKHATLEYHSREPRGKIEVVPTKPCLTQLDLSLAYTPGVAQPCLEIQKDPEKALEYTSKGNLVAVISNGTAVLGLGNIGALAGKPVMEGKGVLFKRFANIDVFDIEVNTEDPEEIIRTVRNIAPTFGGINLEDIKAPECFYVEETLKNELDIPVFHDDQHGTAIISGAALINALELVDKKIEDVKVVFSGAGAAGIACANFYISLGVQLKNVLMVDSKGVLWTGRGDEEKNPYKEKYFQQTDARTLADAMNGADVFCGVSIKGVLTKEMVKTMACKPIIFAMANPDPEITYHDAKEANPEAIVATGRSDYPNQVNNVLGFPFIFRGTLDVQATTINEEMKLAAARSLAALTKEDVPDSVKQAYGETNLTFGPEYIIPKPFDPRVLVWESLAVAEAAIKTNVASADFDLKAYKERLKQKIDWSREFMRKVHLMAKKNPQKIVFPEGEDPKIIWAASELVREGMAYPVLLAKSKTDLLDKFKVLNHDPAGIEIIEPKNSEFIEDYIEGYYIKRQRKGVSRHKARLDLRNYTNFGLMMVEMGHVDGMVAGIDADYPNILRPTLQIIGAKDKNRLVAGLYMLQHQHKVYCLADCAVNIEPDEEDLAEIALLAASELENIQVKPIIAMLSFSNFGTVRCDQNSRITRAVERVRKIRPDLIIDGPMHADVALDPEILLQRFPFSNLKEQPNLLIFPNLDAGNISLKLLKAFGKFNTVGPVMVGMRKPIQILIRGNDLNDIINLTAVACVDAQNNKRNG